MKKNSLPKKRDSGITNGQLIALEGNLPVGVTKEDIQRRLAKDLQRTMEGVTPRLPLIKVLPAGVCQFELPPDETGEQETVKEIEAIIIDQHPCNAWWEKSYGESGGGELPDCSSLDGIVGTTIDGDTRDCKTCSRNQFGTAKDEHGDPALGKACKNMKRVHLLREGNEFPDRLSLPPSCIKSAESFFSALANKGIAMTSVKTLLGLVKGKSKQGYPISLIQLKAVGQIDVGKYWAIQQFLDKHLDQIRGQEIRGEEYEVENGKNEPSEKVVDEILGDIKEKEVKAKGDEDNEPLPF